MSQNVTASQQRAHGEANAALVEVLTEHLNDGGGSLLDGSAGLSPDAGLNGAASLETARQGLIRPSETDILP